MISTISKPLKFASVLYLCSYALGAPPLGTLSSWASSNSPNSTLPANLTASTRNLSGIPGYPVSLQVGEALIQFYHYGPRISRASAEAACRVAFEAAVAHDTARVPTGATELVYRAHRGDVQLVFHTGDDMTWYALALALIGIMQFMGLYCEHEMVDLDFDVEMEGFERAVGTGFIF